VSAGGDAGGDAGAAGSLLPGLGRHGSTAIAATVPPATWRPGGSEAHQDGPVPVSAHLLDELAANATTAGVVQVLDGWLLRVAPDLPFRRSSSAVPLAPGDARTDRLEALVAGAERFYERWGVPCRFQLTPTAATPAIDALLAARGYVVEAPVEVLAGPLEPLAAAGDPAIEVAVEPSLTDRGVDAWLASPHARADERADRLQGFARLLPRIGPPSLVAWAAIDGRPAAVGIGVVERGWLGIFGMATLPGARRRGCARAVAAALAVAAAAQGARSAYLQVEQGNGAARSLYRRLDLAPHHAYHYRTRPPLG
jgi:N-acetylglutamate synthase